MSIRHSSTVWILQAVILQALLCTNSIFAQAPSETAKQDARTKYWVFLVTGKDAQGVPPTDLAQKQQAHLANFLRLAKAGDLFIAGPMSDPQKTLRGILVAAAKDPQTLSTYFDPDPYVKEGYMNLEANPIAELQGDLTVVLDPRGLEQWRIVVWDRTDKQLPADSPTLEAHRAYWNGLRDSGQLAVRARFGESSKRFGVAIIVDRIESQIKALCDDDPLVKEGFVTYQQMPQYLGKGAVKTVTAAP